MNRKWSFGGALVLAGLLAGVVAAADSGQEKTTRAADPHLVHTVIFHLKKDAPAGTAEKVIEGCHTLSAIPTVDDLKAGPPAPTDESTEKVVVRDYDIGLVVFFDDAAGLKTYLTHPTHLKFLKEYAQYFESVQVYDFVNQKK